MTPVRGPLVLIVQGDAPTLTALALLLRSSGFGVLQAQSGHQALRLLNTNKPQLALLDVDLPDMSGLDLSLEIKTDPLLNGVKVVLCSAAFLTPRDQLHGLEIGKADMCLKTPIKPVELMAIVQRLLRNESARPPRRSR